LKDTPQNSVPSQLDDKSRHNMVFLTGFMGAGKSHVGMAISQRLGWNFCDLDQRIEELHTRSIAELFRDVGEDHFRVIEASVLADMLAEEENPRVLALGGGTFVSSRSSPLIHDSGSPVIFLDAPVEELLRRCQSDTRTRPLLKTPDDFRNLYQQRRPAYLTATLTVTTLGKNIDAIAEEVICWLGLD